jgi:hypothetical protein
MRPVNKRGAIITKDAAFVRTLVSLGVKSPNAEIFLHDSVNLSAALAAAVHAGADPGPDVDAETRGFMRFAHANFSDGAFGAAARRSGLSEQEAAMALKDRSWDPFADVEMPLRDREPDETERALSSSEESDQRSESKGTPRASPPTWEQIRDESA